MKGATIGPCNCDWGCPCNFDAPPTYGHCDGVYLWALSDGRYGDMSLAGLSFAWAAHSPGPLHEGNLTAVWLVDEQASPDQRAALEALFAGPSGLPFDIFGSITTTLYDTIYAPFEVELSGIDSKAKIAGGEIFELVQSRVKNPVTGEEEELYLDKPRGFTSTRSELGMAPVANFRTKDLVFEGMNGKYAEYAEFTYSGP
jgi:hypothetical protein